MLGTTSQLLQHRRTLSKRSDWKGGARKMERGKNMVQQSDDGSHKIKVVNSQLSNVYSCCRSERNISWGQKRGSCFIHSSCFRRYALPTETTSLLLQLYLNICWELRTHVHFIIGWLWVRFPAPILVIFWHLLFPWRLTPADPLNSS